MIVVEAAVTLAPLRGLSAYDQNVCNKLTFGKLTSSFFGIGLFVRLLWKLETGYNSVLETSHTDCHRHNHTEHRARARVSSIC